MYAGFFFGALELNIVIPSYRFRYEWCRALLICGVNNTQGFLSYHESSASVDECHCLI